MSGRDTRPVATEWPSKLRYRERKAARLVEAIRRLEIPREDVEALATAPDPASDPGWRSLAKLAGANPPSAATVRRVLEMLDEPGSWLL